MIKVFIDGSCRKNGSGAYGAQFINERGEILTILHKEENTTNNKMELSALIEALRFISKHKMDEVDEIVIYCDSQYVVSGLNQWLPKWKAKGYKTTTGPVKNLEYWKTLEELKNRVKFELVWVKGHADSEGNNAIDRLVNEATGG